MYEAIPAKSTSDILDDGDSDRTHAHKQAPCLLAQIDDKTFYIRRHSICGYT